MLQASGAISCANINSEMGYPASQLLSINEAVIRGLGGKTTGAISMSDFYGKANRKLIVLTIAANTQNYTLNPAACAGYIAGITDVTFTINSGIIIGSASTGSAALTITGFAAGDTVAVVNNGYIVGRGGSGGNGRGGTGNGGSAGSAGGLGLSVSFPTKITNNGTIGGGGGGGGGGGAYYVTSGPQNTPTTTYYSGGGGGGGAGNTGGTGGLGDPNFTAGTAGGAGATTAGGNGGSVQGGVGGSLGVAGGSGGSGGNVTGAGYVGGAAGACTSGNVNITWLATGTRAGALN